MAHQIVVHVKKSWQSVTFFIGYTDFVALNRRLTPLSLMALLIFFAVSESL